MQVTQDYRLQYFREEVWNFTRACDNLIRAAEYLSLEERAVIAA
jgi:hypothetical protein